MSGLRLSPPETRRRRGIRALKTVPILPSLVTLGNVFFGFLAMAKAADAVMLSATQGMTISSPAVIGKLQVSALLIFVAMIFDALDGAVARMTRQTSAFGAQLDSMADMVTFGMAPAFLAKVVIDFHTQGPDPALSLQPKIIYASAVVYVLCAAMRLARFNVEVPGDSAEDHQEFSGLPTPAAAAGIAAMLTFFCFLTSGSAGSLFGFLVDLDLAVGIVKALPICLVLLGLLMVSRVPYPHLVVTMLKRGHSFPFLASLVVLLALIALEWEVGLLALISIYVLIGFGLGLFRIVTTGRLDGRPPERDVEGPPPRGGSLN